MDALLVNVVPNACRQTHHHKALCHHTEVNQIHRHLHLAVLEAVDPIAHQANKSSQA